MTSQNISNTQSADIAIVGGGMVGLSQALLLSHQLPQARIVLFDTMPLKPHTNALTQPSFDARSTALSSATAELLALINLWPTIAERAEPIRRVHVSDRGHIGATDFNEQENNGQALGYVVENRWFGYQLAQAVLASRTIEVVAPATVNAVRPLARGAQLQYCVAGDANEQTLQVELVIIGDGAESLLRKQLGIAADEYNYQQVAVIANVEFEQPHQGQAFERFTAQGPMAVLPLPADDGSVSSRRSALVWTRPKERNKETMAWTNDEFIAQFQRAFGYRLGRCTRVGERNQYDLKMIFAKEQVRSSIALVGNAAHFLHPVAGQGFNLALRDCAQLAAVLAQANTEGKALGHLSVLNRYLTLQDSDQTLTAGISHAFIQVFSHANPAVQLTRNMGLLGLELFTGVKQEFFSQMMGRTAPRARLRQAIN